MYGNHSAAFPFCCSFLPVPGELMKNFEWWMMNKHEIWCCQAFAVSYSIIMCDWIFSRQDDWIGRLGAYEYLYCVKGKPFKALFNLQYLIEYVLGIKCLPAFLWDFILRQTVCDPYGTLNAAFPAIQSMATGLRNIAVEESHAEI